MRIVGTPPTGVSRAHGLRDHRAVGHASLRWCAPAAPLPDVTFSVTVNDRACAARR